MQRLTFRILSMAIGHYFRNNRSFFSKRRTVLVAQLQGSKSMDAGALCNILGRWEATCLRAIPLRLPFFDLAQATDAGRYPKLRLIEKAN
ncbi:hypothetical protein PSYAR_12804 [Pseudomonas syringae pv. aceris str. M302273]|nr:hypothetical protein PSYAR_12804 [Pseudomonas syringae pv. aceris str. M302273]